MLTSKRRGLGHGRASKCGTNLPMDGVHCCVGEDDEAVKRLLRLLSWTCLWCECGGRQIVCLWGELLLLGSTSDDEASSSRMPHHP